jgi:hypothetical protein
MGRVANIAMGALSTAGMLVSTCCIHSLARNLIHPCMNTADAASVPVLTIVASLLKEIKVACDDAKKASVRLLAFYLPLTSELIIVRRRTSRRSPDTPRFFSLPLWTSRLKCRPGPNTPGVYASSSHTRGALSHSVLERRHSLTCVSFPK